MKKVVALLVSLMMLLSAAAMAEAVPSITNEVSVLSVEPEGVEAAVNNDSETVQAIAGAITEVGMTEAFGSAVENPEDYTCTNLVEFSLDGVSEDVEEVVVELSVPGVKAGDEVVVLLGIVTESNVEWSEVEVVSVEDGVVKVALNAEQAKAAAEYTTILAFLVK